MKIYVINMKRSVERKHYMIEQFERLSITNYEFIEAIDGSKLSIEEIKSVYSDKTAKRLLRELTYGEIGCALSHQKVYKKILEDTSNERCIIIEDDVEILPDFAKIKDVNFELDDIDIIFFGCNSNNVEHLGVKTFPYEILSRSYKSTQTCRCYLKKDNSIKIGEFDFYQYEDRMTSIDSIIGTCAYSVSKSACKKLLKYNTPISIPVDWIWNMFSDFIIYGPAVELIKQDLVGDSSSSTLEEERKQKTYAFSKIYIDKLNRLDRNI